MLGAARRGVRRERRLTTRAAPHRPRRAPEFTLADYQHALGELRGTPVVVNVWASWCGPCREEAPLLAAAHRTYGDRVRFLGVDVLDESDSARAFMHRYGWSYPSVYDPTGAIRDGLGLLGQPVTLFYDAAGRARGHVDRAAVPGCARHRSPLDPRGLIADPRPIRGRSEGVCYARRAMAAVCDICGKKPFFGMQVSHSHRRSPKRWNPNVQRVRALVNGTPKRLHVCTSCLKAGKVQRAV